MLKYDHQRIVKLMLRPRARNIFPFFKDKDSQNLAQEVISVILGVKTPYMGYQWIFCASEEMKYGKQKPLKFSYCW